MAREIAARYRDMPELARDLRAYLEGRLVSAYETGAWAETKKWVRRNRALAASLAAVVLVSVVGVIVSTSNARRADENARRADDNAQREKEITLRAKESERLATDRATKLAAAEAKAQASTDQAERARTHAEQQEAEAKRNAYFAAITGAAAARRINEPATVQRLLKGAPIEHRRWEWHHLNAVSDTSLLRVDGSHAVLSQDGSRIICLLKNGSLQVLEMDTGSVLAEYPAVCNAQDAFGMSKDGTRLLTVPQGNFVCVVNAFTGQSISRLEGHTGEILSASITSGGDRVVTSSSDGTTRVWDVAENREVMVLQHTRKDRVDQPVASLFAVFSPDSSRVVTASNDNDAHLWDAGTGQPLKSLRGHERSILSASFSFDGTQVATASTDGTVRIWSFISDEDPVVIGPEPVEFTLVAFNPSGDRLVTASTDSIVRVWEIATGKMLLRLDGHADLLRSVAFSHDGTRIITVSEDGTARIWDSSPSTKVLRPPQPPGCFPERSCVAFTLNGIRIATSYSNGSIRVWVPFTGVELALLDGYPEDVTCMSISPDGSKVVTGSSEGSLRVWDLISSREAKRWSIGKTPIQCIAISSEGARIAIGLRDGPILVCDMDSEEQPRPLPGQDNGANCVAFSPDGSKIAVAVRADKGRRGEESGALLLDSNSGELLWPLVGHSGEVLYLAFSPEGDRVVTAAADRTARVWSASTGEPIACLEGHTSLVRSAAFSSEGDRILTASSDSTARVWEASSGKELLRVDGASGGLQHASFTPDVKCVITVSDDGAIRELDSVDYRARWAERKADPGIRTAARELVNRTLAEVLTLKSAVDLLSTRSDLEEPVRCAAHQLLIARSHRGWIAWNTLVRLEAEAERIRSGQGELVSGVDQDRLEILHAQIAELHADPWAWMWSRSNDASEAIVSSICHACIGRMRCRFCNGSGRKSVRCRVAGCSNGQIATMCLDCNGRKISDCIQCEGRGVRDDLCGQCEGGQLRCRQCAGKGTMIGDCVNEICKGGILTQFPWQGKRCPTCNGVGTSSKACRACGGGGKISCSLCTNGIRRLSCSLCKGTGRASDRACAACQGRGQTHTECETCCGVGSLDKRCISCAGKGRCRTCQGTGGKALSLDD